MNLVHYYHIILSYNPTLYPMQSPLVPPSVPSSSAYEGIGLDFQIQTKKPNVDALTLQVVSPLDSASPLAGQVVPLRSTWYCVLSFQLEATRLSSR